jgi:hypothetical protein
MQHTIVTVTLIFTHDMFRSYAAIIRCPHYAKLFTALLAHTTENNNALQKWGNGSATKETYIKEINVHTNIDELHETHLHCCRLC